jgi:GNAT superfamily N-acetyltransferase
VSDPSTVPTSVQPDTDAVAALVRSWAVGWAMSRGFTAPEPAGAGLWVRPGEPGRERELVWPLADQDMEADLLATIGASPTPTWVTVATLDVSQTQGVLSERGVVPAGWPEWLMSKDLATVDPAPSPETFTTSVQVTDGIILATALTAAGQVACSGQMAVTGDGTAVADRVVTEERFRRRGLGRYLMSRLGQTAREHGATTGLLIASAEGHGLYTAIGWSPLCDVVVARNTSAMA